MVFQRVHHASALTPQILHVLPSLHQDAADPTDPAASTSSPSVDVEEETWKESCPVPSPGSIDVDGTGGGSYGGSKDGQPGDLVTPNC